MAEHDLNTPHGLLLEFLGDADNIQKVVVASIVKKPDGTTDIAVGHSAMPLWEVIGILRAAADMKEVDFQAQYWEGMEGEGDGDEGSNV